MASPYGRLVVVVNPQAGSGRVGREMPEVERQLRARNLAYRIVTTGGPGDASTVTRQALLGDDRFIVAVGGDGTLHEVVNGMIEDNRLIRDDAVLGVVAAGSGSDFVRTFGLPGDAARAVAHLAGDAVYRIDAIRADYRDGGRDVTRYVANIAEAGLGAAVVARAARLPLRLGRGRYFLGFWLTLRAHRPATLTVHADRREWSGRANNVVVANCQFYGGGMRISPRSSPSDGVIDAQISTGPRSEAFTMLPKIYRGEHLPHPHLKELRGRVLKVEAERPLPLEADGEVLGTTPATFTVLPEILALKI